MNAAPPSGVAASRKLAARAASQASSSAAGGTVEVSDEGPGIPADDLPYIFDRFYRSAKARALPGSGLGLAIVRRIAEMHGGTAEAIPLQQGVKFRISVPEAAVDQPLAERPSVHS